MNELAVRFITSIKNNDKWFPRELELAILQDLDIRPSDLRELFKQAEEVVENMQLLADNPVEHED